MATPFKQVVLFGDSLFEGCSAIQEGFSFNGALQDKCNRTLDVINRGLSGYNTKNCLELLPKIFLSPAPTNPQIEYLLILLGANDACLPVPTNKQGVPLDQYKDNLIKIITHDSIKAHKDAKILLVTPPPLDEHESFKRDLENGHKEAVRKASVSAQYSETVRQVASEIPGVILVDLHKALMDKAISMTPDYDPNGPPLGYPEGQRGGLKDLLTDGLHMSGAAYRVFFDIVQPRIHANKDAPVFPGWREMNPGGI
ncbi:SGNH hydrolase [Xylariaceae sp. FL0255]|nr:SGNH hydrolase [Xylariaceae sp. FL0255]